MICTMNHFWPSCQINFRICEVYLIVILSCTPQTWLIHNFILHQFLETWFNYIIVHLKKLWGLVRKLAGQPACGTGHENQPTLCMWGGSTRFVTPKSTFHSISNYEISLEDQINNKKYTIIRTIVIPHMSLILKIFKYFFVHHIFSCIGYVSIFNQNKYFE